MMYIGNQSLLHRRKVAFFAPGHTAPLSVMPTLDWASDIAQKKDITVVSGFRSPLEKEVLKLLLRGHCGILIVLARNIYKVIPQALRPYFDARRILFAAEEEATLIRPSRQLCFHANVRVAEIADTLTFASLPEGSSLNEIYRIWHSIKTISIII